MSGSSPQLSDNDVNNSDTLVVDRRDPVSPSQSGNSASLDAASGGNSPLAAGVLPPGRRERKSLNVRRLMFIAVIAVYCDYRRIINCSVL